MVQVSFLSVKHIVEKRSLLEPKLKKAFMLQVHKFVAWSKYKVRSFHVTWTYIASCTKAASSLKFHVM